MTFKELEHEPTYTSEQSAAARGEELSVGAKALLVKVDAEFKLFVLPADRKLDSRHARRLFAAKKIRFASADELQQLTGLTPGSVPPFGEPILPFELYADEAIGQDVDRVAFNAGSLTRSIMMAAADWYTVALPRRLVLSKEPSA